MHTVRLQRLSPVGLLMALACGNPPAEYDAARIHQEAWVWDAHIDTPSHMHLAGHDIGRWADSSQVDLPKMDKGGLDGGFFAVFVYPSEVPQPRMAAYVSDVIATFEEQVARYADRIEIALTYADVDRIQNAGKKVAVLSIEGGHPLQNSLDTLRMLYDRGVRSITLTHFVTNEWADPTQVNQSSMGAYFAAIPRHGGLTDFGRDVVREMNRLGIIIDLSHVSAETCRDVFAVTSAPVIFSHSNVLALCEHHRNVSDDILQNLKANNGVICLTFVRQYLTQAYQDAIRPIDQSVADQLRALRQLHMPHDFGALSHARRVLMENARATVPMPTTEDLVDHIDYLVNLIGIDHIGIGSDFDGWWNVLGDVHDASEMPNITRTLLKRGYTPDAVRKILGENLLRVIRTVM